jgi:hypothetical protein
MVRSVIQVDRGVAGVADRPAARNEASRGARGPDVEDFGSVPEPRPKPAAEEDQERPVAGLGAAPRTEAGPRPEAVVGEGCEAPAAGQAGHAARCSLHPAIVRAPGADSVPGARLAAHIDDPQARRRFAAATEELSEP